MAPVQQAVSKRHRLKNPLGTASKRRKKTAAFYPVDVPLRRADADAAPLEENPEGGGRTMMEDLKQNLKEQAQKVEQLRGYL
jgi:hypothetical protein